MKKLKVVLLTIILLASFEGISKEFDTRIYIEEKGAETYYVVGQVQGYNKTDFMIDTGSGYTAINETMLRKLRLENNIEFMDNISAVMANGKQTTLPVYRIATLSIGGKCTISNIKAVILPGDTRNILGLNALKKAAPFAMSMNPPELILSHCQS